MDPRRGAIAESTDRVAIGIPELDHYLWGGIPRGNVALVIGSQFVGKEALARTFLAQGIANDEPTISILTDADVREWKDLIQPHVVEADMDDGDQIVFMDLFPARGADEDKSDNVIEIERPLTAEKTADACHRVLDAAGDDGCVGRFVFDSLSTLVHERGMAELYDHLPPLMGRVRRTNATGLVLVEEGVLDPRELRILQRWFNGVIELRRFEDTDAVRIEGLGLATPSPWIRYENLGTRIAVRHQWSGGRIH